MEENIEKVERLINRCKECNLNECINCEISWTEVQGIENLIKGYREKEESEKYLYDAYQDAGKKMFEYAEQNEKFKKGIARLKKKIKEQAEEIIDVKVDKVTRNYIPKSKVKEKIEELSERNKARFNKS